jgi:hypothetical protein
MAGGAEVIETKVIETEEIETEVIDTVRGLGYRFVTCGLVPLRGRDRPTTEPRVAPAPAGPGVPGPTPNRRRPGPGA